MKPNISGRQQQWQPVVAKQCLCLADLQSWTKFLGQIYICGAFSRAALAQPLPPPPHPPTPLKCWTRLNAISPEFQHCIGGEGGKQRILKRITVLFQNSVLKKAEN